MTEVKKNKLQDAISAIREVFYDAVESRIRFSGRSYAAIASELGCSEQLVFQVAKLRGLGRNSQQSSRPSGVADLGHTDVPGGSDE